MTGSIRQLTYWQAQSNMVFETLKSDDVNIRLSCDQGQSQRLLVRACNEETNRMDENRLTCRATLEPIPVLKLKGIP